METPTDPSAAPESSRAGYSVVTEKQLVRRPAGRLLWVLAVLLPLALTGLVGATQAGSLASALESDVRQALRAEGIRGVRVVADGRSVEARVRTDRQVARVLAVVDGVPGVMAVTTRQAFASKAEARACSRITRKAQKATRGQRIPFAAGSTALSGAGRQRVEAVAALLRRCPVATAIVGGHTDSSAADPGRLALERARVLVRVLVDAGIDRARLSARGYGDQFEVADGVGAADRAANERGSIVVEGP